MIALDTIAGCSLTIGERPRRMLEEVTAVAERAKRTCANHSISAQVDAALTRRDCDARGAARPTLSYTF